MTTERPAMLAAANHRLRAVGSATAPAATFAWAVVKNWAGRTWSKANAAARKSGKVAKGATNSVLVSLERTLLSHSGRERTQAFAVWALILAFGVTSVDFLITGGPEFSQGARAAPYVAPANLISARTPRPLTELAFAAPVEMTTVDEAVVDEATVTQTVSRADAAQLIDAPNPPKAEIERTESERADQAKPKGDTEGA